MRLIDLDQPIIIPIVDESKGGIEYEMQMTVGEMFDKFCGFQPEVVDAIPVEWLQSQMKNNPTDIESAYDDICLEELIKKWQKEQVRS